MVTVDKFSTVSIRGRMAFGIHCLEIALRHEGYLDEPVLQTLLLPHLYAFVGTDVPLDSWDRQITEVMPMVILDDHPDNDFAAYHTLTEEQALELLVLYGEMGPPLCTLIDDVVYIGRSNLYTGFGDYSPASLSMVQAVITQMNRLALPLPSAAPYQISPVSEGWGEPRPMRDFGPGW